MNFVKISCKVKGVNNPNDLESCLNELLSNPYFVGTWKKTPNILYKEIPSKFKNTLV